jgi:arylsulfatase A-like enzyme
MSHGIFATILDCVGIECPADTLARAAPLERQENEITIAQVRHQGWYLDALSALNPNFDQSPYLGDWFSARRKNWKLVRSSAGRVFLYNLDVDPSEEHDVSSSEAAIVQSLLPIVESLPPYRTSDTPSGLPTETLRLLRGLGYIN